MIFICSIALEITDGRRFSLYSFLQGRAFNYGQVAMRAADKSVAMHASISRFIIFRINEKKREIRGRREIERGRRKRKREREKHSFTL